MNKYTKDSFKGQNMVVACLDGYDDYRKRTIMFYCFLFGSMAFSYGILFFVLKLFFAASNAASFKSLCHQETIRRNAQAGVVVKAPPSSPLIVTQSQVLFQVQYCLVKNDSWFSVVRLIDGITSFPCAIVAGSFFDPSYIPFATTRHSTV